MKYKEKETVVSCVKCNYDLTTVFRNELIRSCPSCGCKVGLEQFQIDTIKYMLPVANKQQIDGIIAECVRLSQ